MMQDAGYEEGGWADELVLREGMSSYRDLEVYRAAHEIAVRIHRFTLRLPKYEMHEVGSQLRRASKAISANLVEGYGRRKYKAEFLRFLTYSHASCDETTEWLRYVGECHSDLMEPSEKLLKETEDLGRRLNRFVQGVERSHLSPK